MRTTPLPVRASPAPAVVRIESIETLRDSQGEARTQRLASNLDTAVADEVEENRNAVAWSEKSGDALGIRQCGYFPTKDIQKATKVCFRGLLVRIVEGFIRMWRAVPRFSTSLPQCRTSKVTLRRCNKGYSVISVCLAAASLILHLRP